MIPELHRKILDRDHPLRIHLIGVAGSGMSGLARLLLEMGHRVSGSDRVTSGETENLRQSGLDFSSPHSAEAVRDADAVVYSSAIRPENPALAEARRLGIPTYRRAECLAALLACKKGVIVAGTHGKTTTSSMSTHLLRKGNLTPSHYVGAEIPVLGANAYWDEKGAYFVAEGDESDGTLALYEPEHAILLNLEEEHLDHYKDIHEIRAVFQKLIDQTRGAIIFCAEDENARELCAADPRNVSYGWQDADWTAREVSELGGRSTFTVFYQGAEMGRVELGIPGRHNILNALASLALGHLLGVDFQLMARALSSFAGAKRRFETVHLSPRYRIIDDYGHHPTEIAATLQTARSLKPQRLVVYFQPHRFTRTQRLADDFGKALQAADVVYVSAIYP
ncbi:MAG: UDP-N-acetylmuramate--L-alanine ligase, partial [Verrucomicrobiales bacterium]